MSHDPAPTVSMDAPDGGGRLGRGWIRGRVRSRGLPFLSGTTGPTRSASPSPGRRPSLDRFGWTSPEPTPGSRGSWTRWTWRRPGRGFRGGWPPGLRRVMRGSRGGSRGRGRRRVAPTPPGPSRSPVSGSSSGHGAMERSLRCGDYRRTGLSVTALWGVGVNVGGEGSDNPRVRWVQEERNASVRPCLAGILGDSLRSVSSAGRDPIHHALTTRGGFSILPCSARTV